MRKNSIYNLLNSPYVVLGFLLLVFVFNSLNPLINYDENLWAYIGRLWSRNGIPPYVGAVENKTPGVFFLFAISDYLFQSSIFFVRIIGIVATLYSAFLLYKICTKLHSKLAGIFCMLIFGLSMCWLLLDGSYFAHTEVFMVLFSIWAFYFMIKYKENVNIQHVFFAGLCIGIAISFKQIALTTFLAFVLLFLGYLANGFLLKDKVKGVFLFFLGCLTSISIFCLILYFNGVSFYDYFQGAWLILLNSGSKVPTIKMHINNFWNGLIASRFIIFYFFIFLFWFQKELMPKPLFWGLVLWFVFDFFGVNASGYYYGHQIKQVIPSLSIMSGIVMSYFVTKSFYLKRIKPKSIIYVCLIVILFFPYFQTYKTIKFLLKPQDSAPKEMGYWIRDNTSEEDYIYMLGGDEKLMIALLWSERVSSSKYFNSIYITEEKHRKTIYSDLYAHTPKFILKIENDSSYVNQVYGGQIEEFLKSNYVFQTKINGFEIYELKNDISVF